MSIKPISIKNYLKLLEAKHSDTLLEELSKYIKSESKPEAELEIIELWLKSLHEDSMIEYNCETHGSLKFTPRIIQTEPSDMVYKLDNLTLNLQYPSFKTTNVTEMIYTSIKSVSTKDQNIPLDDLSDLELKKLSTLLSLEHIVGIKEKIEELKPVLVFDTCCGVKTVVGFKEIMEIL